ncbi:MAG: ribonucleoside-diphosphate reductase subunit alpha [Thiomargarita sp.]|nr:ribonucleoside-diphosphate reductase subunit alpha [Thiomargarita sp.]
MQLENNTNPIDENTDFENIDFALENAINNGNFTALDKYHIIKRNGQLAQFDPEKITDAIIKAFIAIEGHSVISSSRINSNIKELTRQVIEGLAKKLHEDNIVHIEDIQDQVEFVLMQAGLHKIARAYVLYREEHAKLRTEKKIPSIHLTDENGDTYPLDVKLLTKQVVKACKYLSAVNAKKVIDDSLKSIFDGISKKDVQRVLILTARTLIEQEPNYTYVAARLLLAQLKEEAYQFLNADPKNYFKKFIEFGINEHLLDAKLLGFDLDKLQQAIAKKRNLQFTYLGIQTLYDRYFLHHGSIRFELPQAFFMRVAMGLALNEENKEELAIEFYNVLSKFDAMSSTPTLFNSGTLRPQLSSCYVSTVPDDLEGIFDAIKSNALLSKYAGGLGNDWTSVRGMGAHIKGTNGKSQGVVPFLKVANDTLVACNQGGRRRGSGCAYLETWHIDINEFLELRKNTGDERRRTHDMNTANWIPDLMMERVSENKDWTLFSPDEVPDLHELYGQQFKQRYEHYETLADQGKIKLWKRISAVTLWRKMLTMLFETGHAWILYKDAFNIRNTQQHEGIIHSSNLCTEISLNTKAGEEIAVCNLASINLVNHITDDRNLDKVKLQKTIKTIMRMLDNVIDINYYAVEQARNSNMKHRPVGLGTMGFQDALYKLNIPYDSQEAIEWADSLQELISYQAIAESCQLAQKRGAYNSYRGSLWDKGILPIDSLKSLKIARGNYGSKIETNSRLDWQNLRNQIKQFGMRNSNVMAIAPTATIANLCGVSQSIEPTYQNLFIKSNLSGEFTIINTYLVKDLKELGIWDQAMLDDLKYYDGSIQEINRIPNKLKKLYKIAFEIEPKWLIKAAAKRQKWIDQAQSLNIYMIEPSGRKLDAIYKLAWQLGLKSTYYLRSMGATRVAKSTIANKQILEKPKICSLDDGCESCQ